MPVMDVRLHCDATVVLAPGADELDLRRRIQAALDAVIEPLQELGATFGPDDEYSAQLREEEGQREG
ncbi:MAG: hypothetical protein M0R75_14785 [Dehalococcoidia bacterium]|nr:hypothetical protein [Dehalococcoidia bacterium]